jgi:hypothetical protein
MKSEVATILFSLFLPWGLETPFGDWKVRGQRSAADGAELMRKFWGILEPILIFAQSRKCCGKSEGFHLSRGCRRREGGGEPTDG